MIHPENCTAITEILLTGFKVFQGMKIPMFILFLIIYLVICCENILIFYIIFSSSRLKALMFFIIQCMCLCDLLRVSNIIPKFLNDVLCETPTSTVTGCIVQLQVYGFQGNTSSTLGALMSYDRYLAVCHPLRYSSFVNTRMYLKTVITISIISFVLPGVQCVLHTQLQFCGGNTIPQFFCDAFSFMDLSTSDIIFSRIYTTAVSAFVILFVSLSIFITYTLIICTILKIPSANGRKKTFSTCSSHLVAFSSQSFVSFLVYVFPAKIVTMKLINTFTFLQFFWTPFVNPILYTFNTKEFRAECLKKIRNLDNAF